MNEPILKKSVLLFFIAIGIIVLSVVFFACSIQPSNTTITVNPTISMKNLPKDITSIELKVSGDGMDTITESIDVGEGEFEVEVPAGVDRTFELTVVNPSVTFTGSTTEDLLAGEEVDVSVSLDLTETNIVVPDLQNNRIVQIDDLSGTGWNYKIDSDLGISGITFRPVDIDFDSQGRIYIANDGFSTGEGIIYRIDSITDSTAEQILGGTYSNIDAIAIDRVNGLIYYHSSDANGYIYRRELGPPIGSEQNFNIEAEPEVSLLYTDGFTIGENGYLYITNSNNNSLIKYDPFSAEGSRVVATQTTNISGPWDVLYHNGYIYVANLSLHSVAKFDTNLTPIGSPLENDPQNSGDTFYGPRGFEAIRPNEIVVIDDSDMGNQDRLVSFSDIEGSDWDTYGSSGTGSGQFYFFQQY